MSILINRDNAGIRIDKFLHRELFSDTRFTRGEIIRQIKEGNVTVSGRKVKPSYILKENDVISMIKEQRSMNNTIPNKDIKLEIIYKDKNIIVLNKPTGIQVHPDFHEKNNTLANALVAEFPEMENVGDDMTRPGIVHRLDKDTTGVMVIARNQKTFEELKNKFKNREIEKKYWAIVYGRMENDEGVIDKPMARATTYRKQVVAGKKTQTKIREAVTHYKVLKNWDSLSLLEVTPKTGRTHQIRVHLTSIGHPIVGDKMYKAKNIKLLDAPRQMLHAKSLKFELRGEKYDFEASPPQDFAQLAGDVDETRF